MKLFTKQQFEQLLKNGSRNLCAMDHEPVVKLFLAGSDCKWLLTQIDPENHDLAYGLCDLGVGFPELGYVSIRELESLTALRFKVERAASFYPAFRISTYAHAARTLGYITTDNTILMKYILVAF